MNRIYTDEHKQFIREHVIGKQFSELTEMLNSHFGTNFKVSAIKSLVYRMGLGNGLNGVNLSKAGEAYRFKKGHIPWNKGKPKSWIGGEETQFKKGHKPHNWVPIGTERVSKDGYIEVKIQEGQFQKNWRGKHILIWEQHNGPVPEGHAIIFGDGDKRNFDINNLICVSRKQLVRLNQYGLIHKDAELTRTGIIIADLIAKISEKSKEK